MRTRVVAFGLSLTLVLAGGSWWLVASAPEPTDLARATQAIEPAGVVAVDDASASIAAATSARAAAALGATDIDPLRPTPEEAARTDDQEGAAGGADPGADEAPPPYPWADAVETLANRLRRTKRTLNLDRAPLLDVLRMLDAAGPVPIRVTQAAAEAMRGAEVRLRLRGIRGHQALSLALAAADERLTWSTYPDFILVHRADEAVPAGTVSAEPSLGERLEELGKDFDELPDPRRWEDTLAALDRELTLPAEELTLQQALACVQDATGLALRGKPIGEEVGRRLVSIHGRYRVRDLLDRLLTPSGLTWTVTAEGVAITRARVEPQQAPRTPEGPPLRDRVDRVDVRGGTLRDLAQAFERQGIPVFVAPRAWASAGTTSLVVHDLPLRAVLMAPGVRRHLTITWDPRGGDREALVVGGALSAVTADLLEGPVPGFPAVEADVAARRRELREALARRATLRATAGPLALEGGPSHAPRFAPWPLHEAEAAVRTQAEALGELLATARAVDEAPRRVRELERALGDARAARDGAREAHLALLHAQTVDALEHDLVTARRDAARRPALVEGAPLRRSDGPDGR